jgi:hypothetical protein
MKTILCLALLLSTTWALTGCVATTTTAVYDEPVYYHRAHPRSHTTVYVQERRPTYYQTRTVYKKGHGHHYNRGPKKAHHGGNHRH